MVLRPDGRSSGDGLAEVGRGRVTITLRAEQSLGRLFLAGIGPGVLLVALFSFYAAWRYRVEYRAAEASHAAGGIKSAYLGQHVYSLAEKVEMLPRVLPFVILLIGVIPRFVNVFKSAGLTLPLPTRICIGLYEMITQYWYVIGGALVIGGIALWFHAGGATPGKGGIGTLSVNSKKVGESHVDATIAVCSPWMKEPMSFATRARRCWIIRSPIFFGTGRGGPCSAWPKSSSPPVRRR
jgi:hypothetical protein